MLREQCRASRAVHAVSGHDQVRLGGHGPIRTLKVTAACLLLVVTVVAR
jgi:hypothetical protein